MGDLECLGWSELVLRKGQRLRLGWLSPPPHPPPGASVPTSPGRGVTLRVESPWLGHSCLPLSGPMGWPASVSHTRGQGRVYLCPAALPTSPDQPCPACLSPDPHLPVWALCFRVAALRRRCCCWRTRSPPPPDLVSAGGGGGTDVDNEIFGTLALWEKTPRRLLSLPGITVQDGDCPAARLLAALGVWLRGRGPDLLPGRAVWAPHRAMRGSRRARCLVTDR